MKHLLLATNAVVSNLLWRLTFALSSGVSRGDELAADGNISIDCVCSECLGNLKVENVHDLKIRPIEQDQIAADHDV